MRLTSQQSTLPQVASVVSQAIVDRFFCLLPGGVRQMIFQGMAVMILAALEKVVEHFCGRKPPFSEN